MTESPKHRIALATCNEFPDLNDDDRLLLPAFAELGLEAAPALWNDPAMDWESFESVIIRSTWDYIERFAEFDAWLDRLKARGIRVWNPVATVRENLNKNYLRRFASCGTPTLPTLWLARGERDPVRRILAESDWKEIVVKPAISAGSFRTYRWQREEVAERGRELAEILADCDALVQPCMREFFDPGEWSFLFFGGCFSHALRKRPKPGDFRVQYIHGGSQERVEPGAALLREVEAITKQIPDAHLFARIDGIVHQDKFLVVEIELVEPHFFLAMDPESPRRFAAAYAKLRTTF